MEQFNWFPGLVVVRHSDPVGTVLSSHTFEIAPIEPPHSRVLFDCVHPDDDAVINVRMGAVLAYDAASRSWPLLVEPNIGLRLTVNGIHIDNSALVSEALFDMPDAPVPLAALHALSPLITGGDAVATVELVKLGDVPQTRWVGGLLYEASARSTGGGGTHAFIAREIFEGSIVIAPRSPTCSVRHTDVQVTLSTVRPDEFTGVGSIAAGKGRFQLEFDCDPGDPGTILPVDLTLIDTLNPHNATETLSLRAGAGDASGLGLQMIHDGRPVTLNTRMFDVETIPAQGGAFAIPFEVQYIQTGAPVAPGAVHAVAYFLFEYR